MRIGFLQESNDLWGGVKVTFELAEALADRGHDVRIFTKDAAPDWTAVRVPLPRIPEFSARFIPMCDVVVATFWTTVVPAVAVRRGAVVHFCQGFEGAHPNYAPFLAEIESVYRLPVPAVTNHEPIAALVRERFNKNVAVVGQGLDHSVFHPGRSPSHTISRAVPRVLVVGIYEAEVKGVPDALAALSRLKRERRIWVVRASLFPLSNEERAQAVTDEYHHRITPREMADLYRSCDVLVAANRSAEGFCLPALEAMACGLPVAASDTPTFRAFSSVMDWCAPFAEGNQAAIVSAVRIVLDNPSIAERLCQRGLEVASGYVYEAVAQRMEAVLDRHRQHR